MHNHIIFKYIFSIIFCFLSQFIIYPSNNRLNPVNISYTNLYNYKRKDIKNIVIKKYFRPYVYAANEKEKNQTHRIIIAGINNSLLKNKIIKLFKIAPFLNAQNLPILIEQLKMSGFFQEISINNNYAKQYPVTIITLKPNPLLHEVGVIDFKKKQISHSYLMQLFHRQLGYPKNYNTINSSIDKIKEWYYHRGYIHADISLLNNFKENNEITLNISEGEISKVIITCQDEFNNNIDFNNILSMPYLLKLLSIEPNNIFNIISFKKGLFYLKCTRICSTCDYTIKAVNSNQTLEIHVNLTIPSDRYTYIWGKRFYNNNKMSELIESIIEYSFKCISNNYFSTHSNLQTLFSTPNNISNYSIIHHVYLAMNNLQWCNLFHITYNNSSINTQDLYFNQLIYISEDIFGIKHYIRNFPKKNQFIVINGHISFIGRSGNLNYNIPLDRYTKKHLEFMKLSISRNSYTYNNIGRFILLDQVYNAFTCDKRNIIHANDLSIHLKSSINNNFSSSTQLKLNHTSKKYILFQYFPNWHTLCNDFSSTVSNKIESLVKYINAEHIQKFLSLHYIFNYNKKIGYLKTFTNQNFTIEFSHFFNKTNNIQINQLNSIDIYSHKLKIHLLKDYSIKFFKNLTHYISHKCEFITFIGSLNNIPFNEKILFIKADSLRGYKDQVLYLPDSQMIITNLEYQIPIQTMYKLVFFIDSILNWNTSNLSLYQFCLNTDFITSQLYYFEPKISYGIGLEVNIPINLMPPIRIEYGQNIHNGHYLHLRTIRYNL